MVETYLKDIEEQKNLKETKTILAYVFLNYLGTEKENITDEELTFYEYWYRYR